MKSPAPPSGSAGLFIVAARREHQRFDAPLGASVARRALRS
jgi:hypothetical protein